MQSDKNPACTHPSLIELIVVNLTTMSWSLSHSIVTRADQLGYHCNNWSVRRRRCHIQRQGRTSAGKMALVIAQWSRTVRTEPPRAPGLAFPVTRRTMENRRTN
ncbi:hypothetical protein T4E_7597 [Trichinella pseudospiralis]|uniref:Uncharacterized protein n=1 Tax=Trichinella pseudospiralis TaxID=6337 RepID=A0A0V0XKF6_TRIPS|nr:hypothetical protein T4E_7597 [Trichinella pseudospiralis]